MNIFKNLSNFKDGFEGGAPNNRFNRLNDTNIRQAIYLWTSDRNADNISANSMYGDISRWDVSQVTDMSELFKGIDDFNDDISQWKVDNVTNMKEMFLGASAFNQPLEQWNVGNVTNMDGMFQYASAFNQPLEQWNVGNVTDMGYMFSHAYAFNQPLEQWNVGNVTNMKLMFFNAHAFNQPLKNWERVDSTVGNVTNMQGMFLRARAFNQPLEQWNVGNVTNMQGMFHYAAAFSQPLGRWDVGKVTNMENMFNSARAFNQPLEQWNVGNVTNMEWMFYEATAFLQRYPNADNDPRSVFTSAQTNTSNSIAFNNGTIRTAVDLWIRNREEAISQYGDINTWNVSQVTDMNGLFRDSDFNDNISQWNVRNVTDMETMFLHASTFNQPLGQWNVDNVTLMGAMFFGAPAFNQPLEQWNVDNVTDMEQMFDGASAFLQRYPNADNDPRSVFTTAETNNLSNTQLLQYDPRTRKTIACGVSHSVALRNDGTVIIWGSEDNFIRRNSPTDAGYISVACGFSHSVALHNDGTIRTWGFSENFQAPQGNDSPTDAGYISIACGYEHNVALRNDGTIKTWGSNYEDQRKDSPTDDGYIAIACGWEHNVALRNDGTIRTWGSNRRDQRKDLPTDDGYIAIACGEHHSVALRNDGTIKTWGSNEDYQRKDSPTDAGYIAIACGMTHSVALKNDGTIRTWGEDKYDSRDDSPTDAGYIEIACGRLHSVALRNDGTVTIWGNKSQNQRVDSPTDAGYIAISCGAYHSLALHNDGTIKTWGSNNDDELKDSPTSNDFMIPGQESDDSIIARFYDRIDKISNIKKTIIIERENVFESLKRHINEPNGNNFFNNGTYIKFKRESGIDQGGLTRDFFSLLTNELTEKYFIDFNGYSSIKNDNDNPKEDFNLIGKIFAYAIKTKNNLNIKLNPIVLDFLINSEEIDKIDINESIAGQLFKMFESTNQEQSLKILEKISKENNITKRIRKDLNTLEKLKNFLNEYDKNILGSSPYSTYLSLNEEKWSDFAKICIDDPGFNCLMFDDPIDVPFKYKDDFLLFIIRSFTFTQYLEEFYEFIKGFQSIINLYNLKPFNIKLLNKLIIGDRTLKIDEFLVNLKIVNATEQQQQIIKGVIRKINEENIRSGKDDYLNKFLYLITGSDTLPIDGWQSFTGEEFRLVFNNTNEIRSHTCDDFKYVEIPVSNIAGDDIEKIKDNLSHVLSYDIIVESGQSAYCMAGGRIINGLVDKLRHFIN